MLLIADLKLLLKHIVEIHIHIVGIILDKALHYIIGRIQLSEPVLNVLACIVIYILLVGVIVKRHDKVLERKIEPQRICKALRSDNIIDLLGLRIILKVAA